MSIKSGRQATLTEASIVIVQEVERVLRRMTQTCLTCEHFDGGNDRDTCRKFSAKPPARIIVTGCEAYEEEIPF